MFNIMSGEMKIILVQHKLGEFKFRLYESYAIQSKNIVMMNVEVSVKN